MLYLNSRLRIKFEYLRVTLKHIHENFHIIKSTKIKITGLSTLLRLGTVTTFRSPGCKTNNLMSFSKLY